MTEALSAREATTCLVERRLDEELSVARLRASRFHSPYGRLWDAIGVLSQGGKRIRAQLLLDAYRLLGGEEPSIAVEAACAIELLHLALVIHDDVIDGDLSRRGKENLTGRFTAEATAMGASRESARTWGEASSILAGDLLLTRAHSLFARLDVDDGRRADVLDLFDETMFETAAGEHTDVWLGIRSEGAASDEVLAMIDHKTAAYSFRAPLVLAAVLAGASHEIVGELSVVSRRMGIVYQLRDDVIGTFGDEEETGKSVLSDLREGKQTLLIAHARTHPAWPSVARFVGDSGITAHQASHVRAVLEASGARRAVESVIASQRAQAHQQIAAAEIPSGLKELLVEVTERCAGRRT